MDPHRFDRLSKSIAGRLTRRRVLTGFGASGISAALLAEAPSLAAEGSATCVYDFDGTIDVGPSSTIAQANEIAGELTIAVKPSGAIDSGSLALKDGSTWTVVGQATGRAVSLRMSVPNTGAFVAVGAGRHDVSTCPPLLEGPASGPLRHDLGSWIATLKTPAAATATAPAATAPAEQSTAAPNDVNVEVQPTAVPASPAAESTASACPIECGDDTLGLDPATCTCLCPAGSTPCIPQVHAAHAKGGVISQPQVVDNKPQGYCTGTATDVSNCGACFHECGPAGGSITSSACAAGVCAYSCAPSTATCDPNLPCGTDLSSDPQNCGSCANVCPPEKSACAGGQCTS